MSHISFQYTTVSPHPLSHVERHCLHSCMCKHLVHICTITTHFLWGFWRSISTICNEFKIHSLMSCVIYIVVATCYPLFVTSFYCFFYLSNYAKSMLLLLFILCKNYRSYYPSINFCVFYMFWHLMKLLHSLNKSGSFCLTLILVYISNSILGI